MKWLLVFLLTTSLQANDSSVNSGGEGPEPLGNYEGGESVIRMVSESINIKFGKSQSEVKCRFVFRSTKKGAATNQLIGFPDQCSSDGRDVGKIVEMHATVDGKTVEAEKKRAWTYRHDGIFRASLIEPKTGSTHEIIDIHTCDYFVVSVEFPEDRDVIVERRYTADNGNSVLGDVNFIYTTKTGSVWKGSIGQADFHVTLDGWTIEDLAFEDGPQKLAPRDQHEYSSPNLSEWKVLSPTEMTLTWKNFEPAVHETRRGISLMTWRREGSPNH